MNQNKYLTQMNHALYNEHRRTAAKLDNCTLHNLLRKEDDMANKKDSTMLVKDFVKKWLVKPTHLLVLYALNNQE